ncbi:hypothetical protein Agub_g7050 [Astrephomene gubernaculifera]|uniref:Thioredoxin domain-containing protein n=1 Tax=Astrephomene gubernaculifera TaxID=47775 RepID=A0AAD3DPH3_9CHLO|nr:hypothetical protein Agub_g7050 [Astrephomene gubernaculifera]
MNVLQKRSRSVCSAGSTGTRRTICFARPSTATLGATSQCVLVAGPSSSRRNPDVAQQWAWGVRQDHPARLVCRAGERAAGSEPWWAKDNPSNMKDINSIQELVDALAEAGDRLVVVEFYAQWCNACRALFPKICKIMADNPNVLFYKVNFDDNRDACRTLGVKVLPYFHFYRGAEGRVAAFSCTISKLFMFREALENFSSPFCSLEPSPGLKEFPSLVPQRQQQGQGQQGRQDSGEEADSEADMHPLADTPTVVG